MSDSKKAPPTPAGDDVILLEDLAPRRDVGGGRKFTLGERVPDEAPAPRER
ncbi:MAG: hypothetical protein ACJ8AO_05720 [Gemmatimonadaceae bacterium]